MLHILTQAIVFTCWLPARLLSTTKMWGGHLILYPPTWKHGGTCPSAPPPPDWRPCSGIIGNKAFLIFWAYEMWFVNIFFIRINYLILIYEWDQTNWPVILIGILRKKLFWLFWAYETLICKHFLYSNKLSHFDIRMRSNKLTGHFAIDFTIKLTVS